jgi:hypothetical protein
MIRGMAAKPARERQTGGSIQVERDAVKLFDTACKLFIRCSLLVLFEPFSQVSDRPASFQQAAFATRV